MNTENQIHGHAVMEMMISSGKNYTKESLKKAIIEKFGEEARFHTCSAENMDAEQIIGFLQQKGKFQGNEGVFTTKKENICNH